MSETNGAAKPKNRLGKAQRRLKALALKQRLAESRIRLARLERQAKAEELKTSHWWPASANPGYQQIHENMARKRDQQAELLEANATGKNLVESTGWDWVGGWQDMLDRLRAPDGLLLSAMSIAADRRYGAYWPFFRTWQELALIRGAARILYQTSALARGATQGLVSYIIGDGFSYRAVGKPGAPAGLPLACQDILDENEELNDWPSLEAECLLRDVRDGEWFLRDFAQEDGRTITRTFGPEQLLQPANSQLEEWSFGKKNPIGDRHDVQTTLAYHVCYDGNNTKGIEVPADEVIEHKSNVDRDVKRGLPDLAYDTYDFLKLAGRLIGNMAEGSAIQAAVAEIREWEGPVTGADASDFVAASADYTTTNAWTGQQENVRQVRAGEVRDIPKGLKYVPPPFTQGSPIFIQVEQAVLRAVAVTWNAPEWLTSGDASNNSYSSSLTAESPFIKTGTHKQNVVYKPRFLVAKWRVLRNYCRARRGVVVNGVLYDWEAIQKYIDIQCEPPSMETRNRLDEAQANATRIESGWKSRQTVAGEENLDWDQEKRNMKEYGKEFPDQAGGTAPPGAGAGGGKPAAGPKVPKPPHPLTEAKDAGRWITIGGKHSDATGKKHGGSPVFIQNGRITKEAPGLTGKKIDALKAGRAKSEAGDAKGGRSKDEPTHRQELHTQKGYQRAVWGKKAKPAGVAPKDLHQLAGEMLAHDKEHVESRKRLLKDSREMLTKYGYDTKALTTNLRAGTVEDEIPNLDLVARSMANRYPDQFAGGKDELDNVQRLTDLLTEGNPEVMSENEAYEKAMDHIQQYGGASEKDDFPFGANEPGAGGDEDDFPFGANEPAEPAPTPAAAPAPAAKPAEGGFQAAGHEKVTSAVQNAGLYASRLAGPGMSDLANLKGELDRAVPGMTRQEYEGLVNHLIKTRAIEPHTVNEVSKRNEREKEASVHPPGAVKPVDMFRILDRSKIGPAVAEFLNKAGTPAPAAAPAVAAAGGGPHPAKVAAAMDRYTNRSQTAKGGGLFGGEDLQAREGFRKLPHGAPVVFTGGEFSGQTGKIVRDKDPTTGKERIVAEVDGRPGLVPIDPDAIEPLAAHQSWRTEQAYGASSQGGLFGASAFLPSREEIDREHGAGAALRVARAAVSLLEGAANAATD